MAERTVKRVRKKPAKYDNFHCDSYSKRITQVCSLILLPDIKITVKSAFFVVFAY